MPDFEAAGVRDFVHYAFHEGRFTLAVFAHKSHFLTAFYCKRSVVKHLMVAIAFPYIVGDDREIARTRCRREFQVEVRGVHFVHFDALYLGKLLHAALHLHGLGGLVAETFDEFFGIFDLLLLVLECAHLLFEAFLA